MTPIELVDKITSWESDNGEFFNDYFTHDSVNNSSWAFWLLGKGYHDHANKIINAILENDIRFLMNQSMLYEIYDHYNNDDEWIEKNYLKNYEILAEFLLATPYYTELVTEFFEKN